MTSPPAAEEIVLRVPALPAYGRVVRVGAAALALRQGMSFGEIDDVRLAIDEAWILLLDGSDGGSDSMIDCVFRMIDGLFELEASYTGEHRIGSEAISRFEERTADLLDDYDVDPAQAWVRIRKDCAENA
jgi:hypothetical protein